MGTDKTRRRVWRGKGRLLALRSDRCLIPFSPSRLLEGLEHPHQPPVPKLQPPPSLRLPPDPSLVEATLISARLALCPQPALDLIWHARKHRLLCPIQEFPRQEELISSVGLSQHFPHLGRG